MKLLTDRPVRIVWWVDGRGGQNMAMKSLSISSKTLREFLQTLRIALIDKNSTTVSKNDLSQAIKEALEYTDFSAFTLQPEPAIFLA
ncbi:hypothetical protein BGS_0204 [Beggiatoa sp. SS]|nr:hypothetical protein BGS_0204 [Beggiatoa sp. SS]